MDIQCMACTPPTKWATEAEYKDHLVTFHGTTSPDEAMKLEKLKKANTPVTLPPGVPADAMPTPEFSEIMNQIEKDKNKPVAPPSVPAPVTAPQAPKLEPIKLTYKYTGQDVCGNNVTTLELDSDGKHFAVAYCLFCNKQVEIREVADLNKKETKK